MLTVASPKVDEVELVAAARAIRAAITTARDTVAPRGPGARGPRSSWPSRRRSARRYGERHRDLVTRVLTDDGLIRNAVPLAGPGFVGVDFTTAQTMPRWRRRSSGSSASGWCRANSIPTSGRRRHPRPGRRPRLRSPSVAGDRYTYRELDDFTDLIKRTLQTRAAGVEGHARRRAARAGLPRLLAGAPGRLRRAARPAWPRSSAPATSRCPAASSRSPARTLTIDPSGEFKNERGDRRRDRRDVAVGAAGLPARRRRRSAAATRARRAT